MTPGAGSALGSPPGAFDTCSLAVVEDVLALLVVLKVHRQPACTVQSYTVYMYSRTGTPLLLRKVALLRRRTCWHRAAARRGVRYSFWQRRICVGAVEEVLELTLLMAIEVLLDQGKL